LFFFFFKKNPAQCKQSPKGLKFAQSGHPVWKPQKDTFFNIRRLLWKVRQTLSWRGLNIKKYPSIFLRHAYIFAVSL
jgi:hypothetical protein